MLKRCIAFVTCFLFAFPSSGYSWGSKGHQTVGRIAQLFLQEDNAQTTLNKIQAILKPGESLASIATWADTVKRVHFGPVMSWFPIRTRKPSAATCAIRTIVSGILMTCRSTARAMTDLTLLSER